MPMTAVTGGEVTRARAAVERAFARRTHPGADRVAHTREDCPSYEGNAVAQYFRDRDWRTFDYASLVADYPLDTSACLTFMTVEAFCYYLPSFLLSALDLDAPFGPDAAESVSWKLTRHGDVPAFRERFDAIVAELSAEERAAVTAALRALALEYDRHDYPFNPAERALESYWAAAERRAP